MKTISTDKIRIDGGTQPRMQIDMLTVSEYAESMQNGDQFPPVTVFFDGVDYWLADGFHRYHAASHVNGKTLSCDVHKGTQRDAILYSVGANATNGIRRTNADKRRAVLTLLQDKEWAKWSDRKIAEKCAVNNQTVSNIRAELSIENRQIPARIVERGGTVYEMQTANIGRRESIADQDHDKALIYEREEQGNGIVKCQQAIVTALAPSIRRERNNDRDETEMKRESI